LDTKNLPDVDILIRTGGDMRLSNYLLWQCAYSELFFTPTLWPEFGIEEFDEILRKFATIERRFGGVN
jgi:undecaprenyl diphosphate synthase